MQQIQFVIPDDLLQQVSGYLYAITRQREQLQQLLPHALLLPQKITVHPRNNVTLFYQPSPGRETLNTILQKLAQQNRWLSVYDTVHIIKELLLICLVLHRHNFSIAGLSFDQISVSATNSVLLNLIGDGDSFINYFSEVGRLEHFNHFARQLLVDQLYLHTDAAQVTDVKVFLSFAAKLVLKSQLQAPEFERQRHFWTTFVQDDQVFSLAQLLAKITLFENIYTNQASLQAANELPPYLLRDLFNPFHMLNRYICITIQQFVEHEQFQNFLQSLFFQQDDVSITEQCKRNVNMYLLKKIKEFIDSNLSNNFTFLLPSQKQEKMIFESQINCKLIILQQDKYFHKSMITLLVLMVQQQLQSQVICFRLRLIDDFIHQLIVLVSMFKESFSESQQNIFNLQIDQNGHLVNDKIITEASQYLGQLFPQLLECFQVKTNTELNQFECLMGGLYILQLVRAVFKPHVKVILLVDENDIILNNTLDIDRNIIYSLLINMNNQRSMNTFFVYLSNSQKPKTQQQALLKYKFSRFLERAVIQRDQFIFTQPLLPSNLENIWSYISGRNPNAVEIKFVSDSVKSLQCHTSNYICQYSLIKKFIISSGIIYTDTRNDAFVCLTNLLPVCVKDIVIKIVQQISTQMSFSVDYWHFAHACPHKTDMFINILQTFKLSTIRSNHLRAILFTLATLTCKTSIDTITRLCDIKTQEVISICDMLVTHKLLTKVQNNNFMISSLDYCRIIIKDIKFDDLEITANNIFEYLLEKYELHHTFEMLSQDSTSVIEVKSQLWRLFKSFDISDQQSGKLQVLKIMLVQPKLKEHTNVVFINEPSYSAIMSIDQVLSQSHDQIFNECNDSDEDNDYLNSFIFSGSKQSLLEQALKKDRTRQDLQKIQSLFMRIKTCIMLISSLSPNGVSDSIQKPKILCETPNIFVSNYSTFINYILSRTYSLLQSINQITEQNYQYSIYSDVTNKLQLSCLWYQFIYTPNGISSNILQKLCAAQLNNTGIVLIGWRLQRQGFIKESIDLMLRQLSQIFDFQRMVETQTMIYQIELGFQPHMLSFIFGLLDICHRYYRLYKKNIKCDINIPHIMPITLITEVIISSSRTSGNYGLLLSVCLELLLIAEKHGGFIVANLLMLIVLNWLLTVLEKEGLSTLVAYQSGQQIFELVMNDMLSQLLYQKQNILRTKSLIMATSDYQYQEVMLDITYKQEYKQLQSSIFNTISFSLLSELFLMKDRASVVNKSFFMLMIEDQENDINDKTIFDDIMLLKIIQFQYQFNEIITKNQIEKYKKLRLSIDFNIRLAENQKEAQYYCILSSFIDAICLNETDQYQSPADIQFQYSKPFMFNILTDIYETWYSEFLLQRPIYGAILALGFHLPYLLLKQTNDKDVLYFSEQLLEMRKSFTATYLDKIFINFYFNDCLPLLDSPEHKDVNQLVRLKKSRYHEFSQSILLDQQLYQQIHGEQNVFSVLRADAEKQQQAVYLKLIKQRKISQTENQFGFIYFWTE